MLHVDEANESDGRGDANQNWPRVAVTSPAGSKAPHGQLVGVTMKTLSNYTNHLAAPPLDQAFAGRAWKAKE